MKTQLATILFAIFLLSPGLAQSLYSEEQLDTLVGPVALYPDPLLTNVLRASTYPDQVVSASKGGQARSDWDDSVKALKDYPDVLTMMAANTEWMNSLGWAAANQLKDVTDAVQRFRYRAKVAGNLETNDKVQVIQEGTTIRIESANPQVIYVPTYNPVYVDDHNDFAESIVYGAAIATSAYLWTNVFDWNTAAFYVRPYGWYPPAAYYRPYGWRGTDIYSRNNVSRLYGNNVRYGDVNFNNVNINRGNSVNINNSTRVNNRVQNNNQTVRTNINNSQRDWSQRERPESRPTFSQKDYNFQRAPQQRTNYSTPSLGSYSSAGTTLRQSSRGARSLGTTSFSSGARYGGGGMRGGGRRR